MQFPSTSVIDQTSDFVQRALAGNDASHDFAHIERVLAIAKTIANEERCNSEECEIVALAALLHDIDDWKYSGSETAGVKAAQNFLSDINYPNHLSDRICWIIQRVSFHDELGRTPEEIKQMSQDKLLCIVQDADRLDAIGAIGIARCFTYGGKKGRPLYDTGGKENIVRPISKADYMSAGKNAPTIDHFYEKLLLLKDMMKTAAGKRIAEQRHDFMKSFLEQFSMEINGKA